MVKSRVSPINARRKGNLLPVIRLTTANSVQNKSNINRIFQNFMNPKGYLYGADREELGRDYPAVTLKLNNFSFLIFGQTL